MLRVIRTAVFLSDLDHQIAWYLDETDLDEVFAAELALRFAAAVEETAGISCPHTGRWASASCAFLGSRRLPWLQCLQAL